MATQYAKRGFLMVVISSLLLLSLFTITYAASTIGTNMSTTGTFTQTADSATATRFQNAAGTTTVLVVDTTNTRVGVNAGAAVNTTFEVGGTASISGIGTWADGRFRPQSDAATAFRFQNAAGTASVLIIDTTNARIGIGATPGTIFEVQGTASASYLLTGNTIQVGGYASADYSRFGTSTTTSGFLSTTNDLLITGKLEIDGSVSFGGFASFSANASLSGAFEITRNGTAGDMLKLSYSSGTSNKTFALNILDGDFQIRAPSVSSAFSAENIIYSVSSNSLATIIGNVASPSLKSTIATTNSTNGVYVSGR